MDGDGQFTLVFRDDFNHFDSSRWQRMTHSWAGNLALFSSDTVSVSDGMMTLKLKPAPANTVSDGEVKRFLGAEVRSVDTIEYGRVSARIKFAKGSAVVSSLVTIYTPWPADDWNEFDIESLGKNPREVQFNAMVYTGPTLTPPVTTSVSPTQYPSLQPLSFDSSNDFHVYTIEWTPQEATFLVDGIVHHRWLNRMDLVGLPQNVLLTIWASDAVSWAGPVTQDTVNAEAVYDWVEVWRYQP
jgi:endo-1,3-1,4-beta-glycanase ExoK